MLPLVEVRAPFALSRQELLFADRGAADPDLRDLARAAHRMAVTTAAVRAA
ncbi:encapsulin [Kocuria sp. CPCC 205316]|uniref:encapsulin n=1 Tax=Kocuria TaxID=57493 RepID=UPI0036DAEFEF